MSKYLDPTLLGIIPPMDLGRSLDLLPTAIPDEGISPFPLKLRVHDNSRPTVGSVGLFGARRGNGEGRLLRTHDGVDLLAPIGTQVFAVQAGTVVGAGSGHVRIEHNEGFRYVTAYDEVRNERLTIYQRDDTGSIVRDGTGAPVVTELVDGGNMVGRAVAQGDRIAEVKDWGRRDSHLHFDIRYPFEQPGNKKADTLAVDPTWALYAWEKKRYRNDDATRNVVKADQIQELNEIVRGRLLRFLRIRAKGFGRDMYFPLGHAEDEDRSLVDTLRWAFFHKRPVELVWRESLFFNQIEFVFDQDDKVPILAEVRVT